GEAGLIATIIALFAVLSLVPLFGVLFVRHEAAFAASVRIADTGVNALRRFCEWIAVRMVTRPGFYSAIAVLAVGGLALIYGNLEPRYRLADHVAGNQHSEPP